MAVRQTHSTILSVAALVLMMGGCTPRVAHIPPPAAAPQPSRDWIDLQPGWRVRVVIPITKSGRFLPNLEPASPSGSNGQPAPGDLNRPGTISVSYSAGSDVLGYEVVLYSVRRGRAGEMQVVFRSAVAREGGKTMRRTRPMLRLFQLPAGVRFVRILHLNRGFQGDYDAAILASGSLEKLNELSRRVQRDPPACRNSADASCSWIPPGIAVIPKRRRGRGLKRPWAPA
jgi:hypothetical protein